jgi:acyl-CoA thioester hydrolase
VSGYLNALRGGFVFKAFMTTDYHTQLKLRIDWADLDLFGHVNNVAFFKYVQAARVNYCEQVGLTSVNDATKLSFMVASSQCQFKKPLLYPGDVTVFTKVDWIKNSSLQLAYLIFDLAGNLAAEAADVIVIFDHHNKKKVIIPEELRKTMERIEKKSFNPVS